MHAMTADDVIAVIKAATSESMLAGLALRIAAVTGVRRGELVGLQWGDLDGELLTVSRSLTVVHKGSADAPEPTGIAVGPTKTHAVRRLTLDDESINLIETWRAECADAAAHVRADLGPWMISLEPGNRSPCSPDWLTRAWARARSASGIDAKWRLHDLRHWTATALIASGEDI